MMHSSFVMQDNDFVFRCEVMDQMRLKSKEKKQEEAVMTQGTSMTFAIVWMVVLFGIMYFLMIRPQKKEQKRVQAMLSSMEVGDSVVTSGGFYGVILDLTDEDVIVEFGNNKNCRIPMRRSAIVEVEKAGQVSVSDEK